MRYVLFVCNHNAGRSQMAQAFFERHAPSDIRAESAGSTPARAVWPTVVEAMREVGIDIADRRPKKLIRELQLHADWAVTMGCGDACPYVPSKVEDWDIPDVAGGSLEEVRETRDRIEAQVINLVEHRLDDIRADRTCHELRLQRLIPVLDAEFAGQRSAGEVRTCLDSVLGDYEDAPVRGFVEAIALRRARACLLEDSCAALAAHWAAMRGRPSSTGLLGLWCPTSVESSICSAARPKRRPRRRTAGDGGSSLAGSRRPPGRACRGPRGGRGGR